MTTQTDSTMKRWNEELDALVRNGNSVAAAARQLARRPEYSSLMAATRSPADFDLERAAKDPRFIRCSVQALEPQERERVVAELRKVGVKFTQADELDDDFISLARDLFIRETSDKFNAELAATIEREQLPAYAATTLLLRKPLYASLWALCRGYNGSHGGLLNR